MNEPDMYREWAPPPQWRGAVSCLWEQRVGTYRTHRVVPDGCADIIVGYGGRANLVGLADGPVLHPLAPGTAFRAVRFRAEAVSTVFGLPADELRNIDVPLDAVVGSRRARALVDTVLHDRPDPILALRPPEHVLRAFDLLRTKSVDDTAAALGLSSRQLRRIILAHSGVGPKLYQRVVRLQRFLTDDHSPLAQAAAAAGYADQAHLTREVTRLCGVPPAALRAERAGA